MADHNLMILVVDRLSRKVIDCEGPSQYNWKMDECIARHDLNKVDFVLRERTSTKPKEVEAAIESHIEVEAPNTEVETPTPIREDEEVPYL